MQATRRTPNASLTNVKSFRPELEFEIIKAVLLREGYLKRIDKQLKANGGKVDVSIVGLVDVVREVSLEVVDIINTWEATQFDYPHDVKPFLWNTQNYLTKMCADYTFLDAYPQVADWLGFSPQCNPFFIPPEALDSRTEFQANAFLVFGIRPPPPAERPRAKPIMPKFVKSPYLTPIHNDLDVFPQNSAMHKAKKKEKLRAVAQAAADEKQAVGKDRAKDAVTDPYQNFLDFPTIVRAKKMLNVLVKNNGGKTLLDTFGTFGGSAYSPSSSIVTAAEGPASDTMPPGPGSPMKIAAGAGSNKALPPVPQPQQALGSRLDEGSLDDLPEPVPGQAAAAAAAATDADASPVTGVGSPQRPHRAAFMQAGSPTHTSQQAAASPLKTSMSVAVDSTGSFAGRLGSTSIFSQSRNDFDSTQDGFRQSLAQSSSNVPLSNKAMRLETIVKDEFGNNLSQTGPAFTTQLDSQSQSLMSSTTNASQMWTPHEIVLQKAVRRRGGELYVLTAAATKGRIKAPTRRTRFERLQKDIDQFENQALELENTLVTEAAALEALRSKVNESTEPSKKHVKTLAKAEEKYNNLLEYQRGIESRKVTLKDQNNNYKIVMDADPADIEKQKAMHNTLKDGQALEVDEKLSMSLEDKMACRIQRGLKRAMGKALRRIEIGKRHSAADMIQNLVRRKANEGFAYQRGIELALAYKMQKLARGAGGKGVAKAMAETQRRLFGAALLRRVARGFIARMRTRRKRMFIRAVLDAKHLVSMDNLTPDSIDDLADLLESYFKDYTISVPIAVMTVLRGLLYMMVGTSFETATVDIAGFVEVLELDASTTGWNGMRLILRRKGRFLRKLRAMTEFISIPSPRAITFSEDCVMHITGIQEHIQESHFLTMDRRNRETMWTFLRFIKSLKTAYDFQAEFPEYFIPGQPNWFRLLVKAQREYQVKESEVSLLKYCKRQIDTMRDEFKASGKAWKAVKLAADTNTQEIADAEECSMLLLSEYDRQVALFQKDETTNLMLIKGFMHTREIGVAVSERDWNAFMLAEADTAPEWRIQRQRLIVDKAKLQLLDSKNKIYFANKCKERDERARDFKKVLQLQELRRICKEEGRLLGKLMVLQYVWEDFVKSIGGIQYIYDLKGDQLAYYEETRKEVTEALTERRRLIQKRKEEIDFQFNRAQQIAHVARMGEFSATWDSPTDMELEAEYKEDVDCRIRDADLEAKATRAAKRLKIPPADFKPLMLMIDIRVPNIIKALIKERLEPLHFQEVVGNLSDPTLTLRLQKLMDEKWNIYVFADRGTNNQARAAFLGYFRSLLYSLIPRPRVVALDAFLEFRYDNWFQETAANQVDIFKNNVANSTEASLLLSRLRKTALVFKQCLLFESKQEEIEAGCTAVLPAWLRAIFKEDLDDFMQEIEGRNRQGDDISIMTRGTALNSSGMILAATVAATMGWWTPPLLPWRERQIHDGVDSFMEKVADSPSLCEMLWLKKFPNTTIKLLKGLRQAQSLKHVWAKITQCNFYKQPARYLLSRWALEAMDLVEAITMQGGGADENFHHCGVSYSRNMRWKDDVADPTLRAEQLVGELLHECLSESLIYENLEAEVNEYRPTSDVEDVERQFFASASTTRHVRVYYSGTRAFVGVAIPGMPGENPVWQYFNQMDIVDIVSMLQPNGTELYEGTAERRDISDEGKDKWWELLATWGRMDVIGQNRSLNLLRARYLMLTKVGSVNGHICRFELFEERYAEVLILVHGLPDTGTVYFRVNKECIAHLLQYCDKHEEKGPIQMREPLPIAYIFSDRLQVKPTRNQLWWLKNGDLCPASLWNKPLNVTIRVKGGPGRFVGRKMFSRNGIRLLISMYEISNPSDIQQLRLVIYDCIHCQTIEVRLSEMERITLFNDDSTILEQVLDRFRTVYTAVPRKGQRRPVILLDPSFTMDAVPVYHVDGDQEYVMMDDIALEYSRTHADSDGEEQELAENSLENSLDNASYSDDSQMAELLAEKAEVARLAQEAAQLVADENNAQPWYWCMYFNRTVMDEVFGNLTVSLGVNVTLAGFEIFVVDNRSLYETYRFLAFPEAVKYLYKVKMDDFRKRLKTINENTVYEMADELFSVMEIQDSPGEDGVGVQILALVSEQENVEPYVLAYVRERDEDNEVGIIGQKNQAVKITLQKVEINVLAARNLASISGLAARNPVAIVKWNIREIGRTIPQRNDLNPDWDDPGLRTSTTKDKGLEKCSLEIEVFDYNFQKARTTEFLGCARLTGQALADLFEIGAKRQFVTLPLQRSSRLNDKENAYVQGEVIVWGLLEDKWGKVDVPISHRIVEDEDKEAFEIALAKDVAAAAKAEKGSSWGWGKKTPEKKSRPVEETKPIDTPDKQSEVSDFGTPKSSIVSTIRRPTVNFTDSVTVKNVDRSIRFSMRHRAAANKTAPGTPSLAIMSPLMKGGAIAKNQIMMTAMANAAAVKYAQQQDVQKVAMRESVVNHFPEIEPLGDEDFQGVRSFEGVEMEGIADLKGAVADVEGRHEDHEGGELIEVVTNRSGKALTDDTWEQGAGGSEFGDVSEPYVITVNCLQIEGIPFEASRVSVVVKFNGFEAGRSENLHCMSTVLELADGGLDVTLDDKQQTDIIRKLAWEEEKQRKAELKSVNSSTAEKKKRMKQKEDSDSDEADNQYDRISQVGSLQKSLDDSSLAEDSEADTREPEQDDADSFISQDRIFNDEKSIDSQNTYIIPDRVRRSDVNKIAIFPLDTSFDMIIPDYLDINSCSLEIELWNPDKMELLGVVDLRGSQLKNFVVEQGLAKQWLPCYDTYSGVQTEFENTCGDMIALRLMASATDNIVEDQGDDLSRSRLLALTFKNIEGIPKDFIPVVKPEEELDPEKAEVASYDSNYEEYKEKVFADTGVYMEIEWNGEVAFTSPVLHGSEYGQRYLHFKPGVEWRFMVSREMDMRLSQLIIKVYAKDGSILHKPIKESTRRSPKGDVHNDEDIDNDTDDDAKDVSGSGKGSGKLDGSKSKSLIKALKSKLSDKSGSEVESKAGSTVKSLGDAKPPGNDFNNKMDYGDSDDDIDGGRNDGGEPENDEDYAERLENCKSLLTTRIITGDDLLILFKDIKGAAAEKPDTDDALDDIDEPENGSSEDEEEEEQDEDSNNNAKAFQRKGFECKLNLKARLPKELPPEPSQSEVEAWTNWKMLCKMQEAENLKPRIFRFLVTGREREPSESDIPPPGPVTVVAGWSSRPGTGGVVVPRLKTAEKPGSAGRPGSSSSGINMATAPAMFTGAVTMGGFNFAGARVDVFRQNAMAEAQDLPRRKILLTVSGVKINGKSPKANDGGGWLRSRAEPKVTPQKSVKIAVAAAEEETSISLTLSNSRAAQRMTFLSRYVDCAKYIGRGSGDDGMGQDEADAEAVEAEAFEAERIAYLPRVRTGKLKRTVNLLRKKTLLDSRSGSVGIKQRQLTYISRKRARRPTSDFNNRCSDADSRIVEDPEGASPEGGGKRSRMDTNISQLTYADEKGSPNRLGTSPSKPSKNGKPGAHVVSDSKGAKEDVVKVSDLMELSVDSSQANSQEIQEEVEEEPPPPPPPVDKDSFREVQIFFNGQFVHEMYVRIEYSESPPDADFPPISEFQVPLFVPRGQRLDSCRLEIVTFSLLEGGKKDKVAGVRVFEGQEIVDLFDHQINDLPKLHMPNTPVDRSVKAVHLSPRAGDLNLYDMEAPSSYNNGNREGVAVATEKVLIQGAAELDFEDVTSGLDLGVRGHSRQNLKSREGTAGLQATRRKVEVRLLAAVGVVEELRRNAVRNIDRKAIAQLKEKFATPEAGSIRSDMPTDSTPGSSFVSLHTQDMSNSPLKPSELMYSAGISAAGSLDGSLKEHGSLEEQGSSVSKPSVSLEASSAELSGSDAENQTKSQPLSTGVEILVSPEAAYEPGPEVSNIGFDDESLDTSLESEIEYANEKQEVYAVIRWNGQEIRQSHPMRISKEILFADGNPNHDWIPSKKPLTPKEIELREEMRKDMHPSAPVVDPVASSSFTMHVPVGHRLSGCYLEIALMQGEICLGSIKLHGEDLVSFLEGYGSVTTDEDYYEDFDISDDVATSMRSYPLQYSPSLPRSVQPNNILGRLILRGRVERESTNQSGRPKTSTNPFDQQEHNQFHGRVNLRQKTHIVSMFRIKTKMPKIHDAKNPWRYFFDPALEKSVKIIEEKQAKRAKMLVTMNSEERSSLLSTGKRSVAGGQSLVESSMADTEHSAIVPVKTVSGEVKEVFADQRTGENIPRPFMLPMVTFALELSAIKYVQVNEELQEDCRICWRGRAMPKHFKGNMGTDMQGSMMKSRASRLVRTKGLDDMKTLAEVHFLKDLGNAKQVSLNALPISVKEIVSGGCGLCTRIYRVEITTNGGQPIGQADITSDLDMIQCVGVKHADKFGEEGRKNWDMAALFAWIVNERTEIDFAPTTRKKVETKDSKKESRRAGVSAHSNNKAPHSVIAIMRDSIIPTEVKFKAVYGVNQFHRDPKAYPQDDQDMVGEMLRLSGQSMENAFAASINSSSEHQNSHTELSHKGEKGIAKSPALKNRKGKIEEGDEDSVNTLSDSDSVDSTEDEENTEIPLNFLRMYTKTHRMSGVTFKSIILLAGRVENLFTDPNEYFDSMKTMGAAMDELQVIFRCKDTFSKITHELQFQGGEIMRWMSQIPKCPKIELTSRFRRTKFGEFLLKNLIMRYSSKGEFVLDLINEEIGQLTIQAQELGENGMPLAMNPKLQSLGRRAEVRAEQAAKRRAERAERRAEKIKKIKEMEAERERVLAQKRKEEELKRKEEERNKMSSAGAAASKAADALGNAAGAAKAAFGRMFKW